MLTYADVYGTAGKRLVEHYAKLPLTTSVSQHRIHQDVSYFQDALQVCVCVCVKV